jgi:uncharacterized protein DUF4129
VIRRRLVPLALLLTALLAVVAIVARGGPLEKNGARGAGLPTSFWSFLFTTIVIVIVLLAVAALAGLFLLRSEQRLPVASFQRRTLRALLVLIAVVAFIVFVARHLNLHHLFRQTSTTPTAPTAAVGDGKSARQPPAHVHFQWEELVIVLALLLALAVAAWVTRSRLGPGAAFRRRRPPPEAIAAALDESLDDLRNDPDLRRAIVAAYARMEIALAVAGTPRDPAEAPLEYVERALLTLDASAADVRRLTDLFEWARFSHHEPEPSMRDEAIDALVAVRDELRASELALA